MMGSKTNVRKVSSAELLVLQAQRGAGGRDGGGLDNIDWTKYHLEKGSGHPNCKTDIKIVNSPELLCLYPELMLKAQLQEDRITSQNTSSLVRFVCADGGIIPVHQIFLQAALSLYAPPNSFIETLLKENRVRCCHSDSDVIAISLMAVDRAPLAAALSIICGGGAMIREFEMEEVQAVFRMMQLSRLWDKLVIDPNIVTAEAERKVVQSFDKINPNSGDDEEDDPPFAPPKVNSPRPSPATAPVPIHNKFQCSRPRGTSPTAPCSVETPGDTEVESVGGELESPETSSQPEEQDSRNRNEVEQNEEGGGAGATPGSGLLPRLIRKVPPGMLVGRRPRPRINKVNGPGIKTAPRKRKPNKTGWPTPKPKKSKGRARASRTSTISTPPVGDDSPGKRDELGETVGEEREGEIPVNGSGGDEEDASEPPPPDHVQPADPIPSSPNNVTTAEEDKEETRPSCKSPPQAPENGLGDNIIDDGDGELPGPSSGLHSVPNPNITETSNSTTPTVVVLTRRSKEPEVINLILSSDEEEDDDDKFPMPVLKPAITPSPPTSHSSALTSRKRGSECISPVPGRTSGGIPEKRPSRGDEEQVPSFKCSLCPKDLTTGTELRSRTCLRICFSSRDTNLESQAASEEVSVPPTQMSTSQQHPKPTSKKRQEEPTVPSDVPPPPGTATASTSREPPRSPSPLAPPAEDGTSLTNQVTGNTGIESNNNMDEDDSFRVVMDRLDDDDIKQIMEKVNRGEKVEWRRPKLDHGFKFVFEKRKKGSTSTKSAGSQTRTATASPPPSAARPGPEECSKKMRPPLGGAEQSKSSSGVGVVVVPQPVPVVAPGPPPQNEADQCPDESDPLRDEVAKLREAINRKLGRSKKAGAPWHVPLSSGRSVNEPPANNVEESVSGSGGVQEEFLEQERQPRGTAHMNQANVDDVEPLRPPGTGGGGDHRAADDDGIDGSLLQQESGNHVSSGAEEDMSSSDSPQNEVNCQLESGELDEPSEPASTVDPPQGPSGVYPAESGSTGRYDDLEETHGEMSEESPGNWIDDEEVETLEDGMGFVEYESEIRNMSSATDNFLIMPSPLHETARQQAHRNNSPPEPDPIADLNQESLYPSAPSSHPPPHPHHNEINHVALVPVPVSREVVPSQPATAAASNAAPPPQHNQHMQPSNPVPEHLSSGTWSHNPRGGLTISRLNPIPPRATGALQAANNSTYSTSGIPPIIPSPSARMQVRPGPSPNIVVSTGNQLPRQGQQPLGPASAPTQWRTLPPGVTPPPFRIVQRQRNPRPSHAIIGPGQNPRHIPYLQPIPGLVPGFQRAPMHAHGQIRPPSNSVVMGRNQHSAGQWGEMPPRQLVNPTQDGSTTLQPPPPPAHLVNFNYRPGSRSILRHELSTTPIAHAHPQRMSGMRMMNHNNNQPHVRPQITTTGPATPSPPMPIRNFSTPPPPLGNLPPHTQPFHRQEEPDLGELPFPRVVDPHYPTTCPGCGLLFQNLDRHLPNCLG